MKRCAVCGNHDLTSGDDRATWTVAKHSFRITIHGVTRCSACGESFISGPACEAAELMIAKALVEHGEQSGEALRFMRKALGFKATELAELLDVTAPHVSRWENSRSAIPKQVFALLGAMADDRLSSRSTAVDMLRALRRPKPAGKTPIRLSVPPLE
jgi:putative zinc finger/helix-turn-helix YgiT family protein